MIICGDSAEKNRHSNLGSMVMQESIGSDTAYLLDKI